MNIPHINKPILIVGAGSIGERHIGNLLELGYTNIWVYRKRNLPFRNISKERVTVITEWDEVIKINPFAAIITSPTSLHLSQAIACASLGAHVLVEKPLSHSIYNLQTLMQVVKDKGIYLSVAYMMRFHPLIKKVKVMIEQKELGRLLSFTSKWGEYLPDWHPWEDYQTSYAARKDLGGGAALTLSHDIDLANWLCGTSVKNFYLLKNYRSGLNLDVEAGTDILVEYENGITGHIHLNFFEVVPERYLKMVFDKGSIEFNYYDAELLIKTKNLSESLKLKGFDRNQMFVEELKDFFVRLDDFSVEESLGKIKESELIIKMCDGTK